MSWERRPLKDVGRWFGGGTPSKSRPEFWNNGSIPWLSPKDMGPAVLPRTLDHITPAAVAGSSVRPVPANSVALVVRSGILERTLPVAIVPFETTLNQDMKAVAPYEDVDARWVAWGLRAFEGQLLRTTRKAGTTVASIEVPRLYAFELPVPPLPEQRRTLEILEDHLSRLDAAADYASAASKRLVNLHESTLRATLAGYEVEYLPLSALLAMPLTNGRSVPTRDDGFPVLRLTALTTHGVDLQERKSGAWTAAEARQFLVSEGDFLIARGNGSIRLVGRGSLVRHRPDPVAFPDTIIRVRPNSDILRAEYLDHVWNSHGTRRQIESMARTTAGIYKVNQKQLGQIQLPVPSSLDIQSTIAAAANSSRQAVDAFARSIEAAERRSRALRHAVLAAAFTGKLTGRHTDNDVIEDLVSVPPRWSETAATA